MKRSLLFILDVLSAGAAGFHGRVFASELAGLPNPVGNRVDRTGYWLHPKLGMVKVDRSSNAIVVPSKRKATQSSSAAYWLHPKFGMVKVDRASGAIIVPAYAQRQGG